MKLKQVTIEGMHKVGSTTYKFNNLNYLVGPNGSGKSTVLNAIQLALLGYIPGHSKTNEGILKHAKGKTLSVEAVLDNDGQKVTISRTWIKGSSSKSTVEIQPEGYDITKVLSEIELPIYNFGEFKDMTSNKLKEWFISFLPDDAAKIEWDMRLRTSLADREILDEELLGEVLDKITELSSEGVSQVKEVNQYLKDLQSFNKTQLTRLQGTVNSLIYYDDAVEIDEESAKSEYDLLQDRRKQLAVSISQKAQYDNMLASIQAIQVDADSYEADKQVKKNSKAIVDHTAQLAALNEEKSSIDKNLVEIQAEISSLSMLASGSGKCPYTSTECSEVKSAIEEAKSKLDDLNAKKLAAQTSYNDLIVKINEVTSKISSLTQDNAKIKRNYDNLEALKSHLPSEPVCAINETDEDLVAKMSELQEAITKARANKAYNELIETVTKDKFKIENTLEVLKIWIKLTDANGMQTELMDKPFINLENDMTKYLQKFFNSSEAEAKFFLSEKANSFSFGLVRDEKYIEFDLLSSGEKCLYTIALMMCILDRSNSLLKLIMIDDLLDHLDDTNACELFKALHSVEDVQILLAGVKSCTSDFAEEISIDVTKR